MSRDSVARGAFPAMLLALFAVLVFVPRNGVAAAEYAVVLVAPLILLLTQWGRESVADTRALATSLSVLLVAVVLAVSAFASDAPLAAISGARGQHTGAASWFALALVFALLANTRATDRLLTAARAVSLFSVGLSVAAMLERAGVLRSTRLAESASGLMENSISLGQVLALGVGAGLAWALLAKSTVGRAAGFASAAIALASIVASRARAPLFGLVLTAAVLGAWWAIGRVGRERPGAALAGAVVVLAAVASLGAVYWVSVSSGGASEWIATVLHGRVTIWQSAVSRLASLPPLGLGPDRFTAWAEWALTPAGGLTFTGTSDPHNVLLYLLVSGGIGALALALVSAHLLASRTWVALSARGFRMGHVAVALGVGAWAGSILLSWTNLTAALCATVLLASMLAEEAGHASSPSGRAVTVRIIGIAGSALCLLALVVTVPWVSAELGWATQIQSGSRDPVDMMRWFEATGDPAYAVDAFTSARQSGTLDDEFGRQIADALTPHADRSVDAAMTLSLVQFERATRGTPGAAVSALDALERGKLADPASGLWDCAAALEAWTLGDRDTAAGKAASALEYPLTPTARAQMEQIISSTSE